MMVNTRMLSFTQFGMRKPNIMINYVIKLYNRTFGYDKR